MHPEVQPLTDQGLSTAASESRDEESGQPSAHEGYFAAAALSRVTGDGEVEEEAGPRGVCSSSVEDDALVALAPSIAAASASSAEAGGELANAVSACVIQRLMMLSEQSGRRGSRGAARVGAGKRRLEGGGVRDAADGRPELGADDSVPSQEAERGTGTSKRGAASTDAAGQGSEADLRLGRKRAEAQLLTERMLAPLVDVADAQGSRRSPLCATEAPSTMMACLRALPCWLQWAPPGSTASVLRLMLMDAASSTREEGGASDRRPPRSTWGRNLLGLVELLQLPELQAQLPAAVAELAGALAQHALGLTDAMADQMLLGLLRHVHSSVGTTREGAAVGGKPLHALIRDLEAQLCDASEQGNSVGDAQRKPGQKAGRAGDRPANVSGAAGPSSRQDRQPPGRGPAIELETLERLRGLFASCRGLPLACLASQHLLRLRGLTDAVLALLARALLLQQQEGGALDSEQEALRGRQLRALGGATRACLGLGADVRQALLSQPPAERARAKLEPGLGQRDAEEPVPLAWEVALGRFLLFSSSGMSHRPRARLSDEEELERVTDLAEASAALVRARAA